MAPPVAFITGTSGGVGLHTALCFAAAGFRAVATMRDTAKRGRLLELTAQAGSTIEVLPLDVTDPGAIEAAIAAVTADAGGIDVLVNNAAAPPFRFLTSGFARLLVKPKLADPTGEAVVAAFAARLGA